MRFLSPLNFFLILLISSLFCINRAAAETIELKDGHVIEADILEYSDQGIKISINGETKTFANADISKINGKSLNADLPVMTVTDSSSSEQKSSDNTLKIIREKWSQKTVSLATIFKTTKSQNAASLRQKFPQLEHAPNWFFPAVLGLILVLYLYFCLPYFIIARKLELSVIWQILTLIPGFQILAYIKISGQSLWWALLFLIPLVNIIVMVVIFCCITQRCGKEKLLGLLILVPVINMFLPWYLALNMPSIESLPPSPAPMETKHYSITPFEDENQKS